MIKRYSFLITIIVCSCLFGPSAKSQSAPQRLRLGFSIGVNKITPELLIIAKASGIDYIETSLNAYVDSARNLRLTDEEIISNVKAAKKRRTMLVYKYGRYTCHLGRE
ncbi:hypothetical protein [Niabella ginsengisoli]|uniref:Sugar phosphate isomerase/epimerase n=1 Tax=Niabella ginsengisoli TaxID=522298 RepID=A0ABS9SE42_9BACT|nr:hypothetical protein [Niabella ginsengisoli]MCH5596449.1 hypothetical protein [Niabella ginsengisoli]